MVQTVLRTMDIRQWQFIDKVFDVSVVHVQQIPRVQSVKRQSCSHSCSSSYSCLDNVVACPLCATTDAGWFEVQKTALVPELQCSDMLSGDFQGPVHRYRAGGRVRRDTAPTIKVHPLARKDRHVRKVTSQNPSAPPPPP